MFPGAHARSAFRQLAAWLGSLVVSSVAAEDASGIRLVWRSDTECTAPAEPAREIGRLLAEHVATDRPVTFEAVVTRAQAGYALSFGTLEDGADERRELSFGSCAEVREAVVLLAAMAIDPELQLPAAPPATPRALPLLRGLSLELSLAADVRVLPGLGLGPSLGALVALGPLDLGLHARYLAPRAAAIGGEMGAADLDLFTAALEARALFLPGPLRVGPQAELELGVVRGQAAVGSASALWAALFGGVAASLRVHPRIDLLAKASLGVPLSRPQFALREQTPFFTLEPWTFRIFLGVQVVLLPTG